MGSLDLALVNDGIAAIARHAVSEMIFRSLRLFMRIRVPGGCAGFRTGDILASPMPAETFHAATLRAGLADQFLEIN